MSGGTVGGREVAVDDCSRGSTSMGGDHGETCTNNDHYIRLGVKEGKKRMMIS